MPDIDWRTHRLPFRSRKILGVVEPPVPGQAAEADDDAGMSQGSVLVEQLGADDADSG